MLLFLGSHLTGRHGRGSEWRRWGRGLTGSRVGWGLLGGKVWSQRHLCLRAVTLRSKGLWGLVAKVRPGCYQQNQSTGRAPGEVGAVGRPSAENRLPVGWETSHGSQAKSPQRPEDRAVEAAFLGGHR